MTRTGEVKDPFVLSFCSDIIKTYIDKANKEDISKWSIKELVDFLEKTLDDYSRRWLLDFFPSRAKYIYEASMIRRIIVTESDATYTSNDLPSSYTFTYRLSEISRYLNLIRNEKELPDNLTVPNLSSPDFIFPPRLAELPRQELGEPPVPTPTLWPSW